MALPLNTNLEAMTTQAALTTSSQKKATAMQRLGTGARINSAKDDAAGLAIAGGMESQVRGLTQARRNANDGISLAQTTEGALAGTTFQLQRMRELIVQAANGTNSTANLAAIQAEIKQNLAEIDRISTQTAFNGIKVLATADAVISFQVGAMDSETISVTLAQLNATNIGVSSIDVTQFSSTANAGTTGVYLATIDSAIGSVNSLRANLGAVQNRFTSITASQDAAINNTAAALSLVKDADYAAETTAFAAASVLQKAGLSVLAQANQQPQDLLVLLPR
jgi:flagellin